MEPKKEELKEGDFSPLSPLTPLSPFAFLCMSPLPPFGSYSQLINAEIKKKESEKIENLPCRCLKTKCLKMYCDCFAEGKYCVDCECKNCHNKAEYEDERQIAIEQTKDKNPGAFRKDISSNYKICHCKKSFCLKKYCECFQDKRSCTSNCKCCSCKNI